MRAPEVYVLPRHPTNPGPDRVVFFARSMIEDYDSDEPETPQHTHGSPAQGTLSGFARTLLGKYLQEDDSVQDGVEEMEEWDAADSPLESRDGMPSPVEAEPEQDGDEDMEDDEEDDELPPSPVHMTTAKSASPEPKSPAHEVFLAEKAKFEHQATAPPMTARTQDNVDKLDELAAFADGLSPRSQDGLEQVLDPDQAMLFTARDFMHADVDPVNAVAAAEQEERRCAVWCWVVRNQHMGHLMRHEADLTNSFNQLHPVARRVESSLASMSEEDRLAVLAASHDS